MLFETTRALFGFVSPPRSSCARTLGRRAYEEGRFPRPGGRTLADETAEDEEMRAVASRLGRKEGRLSKSQLPEQLGSSAFTRSHAHPFIYRCLPKTAGQVCTVHLRLRQGRVSPSPAYRRGGNAARAILPQRPTSLSSCTLFG